MCGVSIPYSCPCSALKYHPPKIGLKFQTDSWFQLIAAKMLEFPPSFTGEG
jgi:hypothetical protein